MCADIVKQIGYIGVIGDGVTASGRASVGGHIEGGEEHELEAGAVVGGGIEVVICRVDIKILCVVSR